MLRKFIFGFAVAIAAGLTVGCDSSKDTRLATAKSGGIEEANKANEARRKDMERAKHEENKAKESNADATKVAMEKAKTEMDAAKATFLKPMEDQYPKIETNIKGLTDTTKMGAAKTAFDAFKKQVEEFKAAPVDKYKDLMPGLTTKFDELKKMVGL